MSIGSALGDWVKAILKNLFKFLRDLIKALLPLILVLAALYFLGPTIGSWLSGIPGMSGLATWFTNAPGMILGWLGTVWGWIGSAWTWFGTLGFGTQALIILGGAFLLAPEETVALVSEVASGVGRVVGAIATGLFNSPVLLLVGGFFLLRWIGRTSGKEERAPRERQEIGDSSDYLLEGEATA